jgi:CBS domain-containing protein
MNDKSVASIIEGRRVVVQPPSATVRQAVLVMTECRIGAVPVVEGRHLIGIFTERDVLTRVIAVGRDVDRTRLEEVMTRRPETVSIECPMLEALEVMLEGGFRHLPVMADGAVIGVISIRDIPADIQVTRGSEIE